MEYISGSVSSKIDPMQRHDFPRGSLRPSIVTSDPEVKTQEVIDIRPPAASLNLPHDAKAAFVLLEESIIYVWSIYNLHFLH